MSVFDKLAAIRQVKFSDGEISLLEQRVVITPVEQAIAITELLIEQPELIPKFYEKARIGFSEGFAEKVKKLYGFQPRDFIKWLVDLSILCGWGKNEMTNFNSNTLEGVLKIENSPVGTYFKGKSDKPVDHVWRSLLSAGASRIFQQPTDFIEVKCIAKGDPYCEFIFKPRKLLTEQERKEYKWQLPL